MFFKGGDFYFPVGGPFGYQGATTYALVEPSIYVLWKHPRYVTGREFNLLFDSKKKFGARAPVEYSAYTPKNGSFCNFQGKVMCARAARASARTPKFFF